jgi:hypothetical protein
LKNLLWHGLAPGTRKTYASGQKAYEQFCSLHGHTPWPATRKSLGEFIALRASGATGIGRAKPDTIAGNLSALRSVHTDRQLDESVFDDPWVKRILAGVRRVEPSLTQKQATPITHALLEQLTSPKVSSDSIKDRNFDTACKVAFAGFLRMGEFTVQNSQLSESATTYKHSRLTRSDITFSDDDSHAVLRLKRSKADTTHRGVDIILAATGTSTCPVRALQGLFQAYPLHGDEPLFGFDGVPMTRNWMIATLRKRAASLHGHAALKYSGHSFRRGAAQQASDNGLGEEDIKALGRWSSEAFKRYFKQTLQQRFALSRRFLTHTSSL